MLAQRLRSQRTAKELCFAAAAALRGSSADAPQGLAGPPGVRWLSVESAGSASPPTDAGEAKREPARDTVLVIGGSGFVGSAVCRAALDMGVEKVSSLSRSGLPPALEKFGKGWVEQVEWHTGDVFKEDQWAPLLTSASAVVSCVGAFGSPEFMRRVNGEANELAVKAAAAAGVPRFVFISAHDFGVVGKIIPPGYYEGKRQAEAAVAQYFPEGGAVLLPGMIYGTRLVGNTKLPLQIVGSPLSAVFSRAPWLQQLPLVGPALVPPVPVESVGKAAALAALGLGMGARLSRWTVRDILSVR